MLNLWMCVKTRTDSTTDPQCISTMVPNPFIQIFKVPVPLQSLKPNQWPKPLGKRNGSYGRMELLNVRWSGTERKEGRVGIQVEGRNKWGVREEERMQGTTLKDNECPWPCDILFIYNSPHSNRTVLIYICIPNTINVRVSSSKMQSRNQDTDN